MSCGLSEEMLFILSLLYKGRNFRSDSGYHSKKLNKIYAKKVPNRGHVKLKDAIQHLQNEGYITTIKKKEIIYYISDMKRASFVLQEHEFIKDVF